MSTMNKLAGTSLVRWRIFCPDSPKYVFRCVTSAPDPNLAWRKFLFQFRGSALKPSPEDWVIERC